MTSMGARGEWYALVACVAGTAHGAVADDVAARGTFDLRIAEQPLTEALIEFSRQSGVQIIFFASLTDGLESPGVNGIYSLDDGLRALLRGSGLAFRVINPRTVEIFRPDPPSPRETETQPALTLGCCNE